MISISPKKERHQNSIKKLLYLASKKLSGVDITTAKLDARVLLCHSLQINLAELILKYDEIPSAAEVDNFNQLLERRLNNEPIAYIVGIKEFFGRDFFVNKHVLIPRPDTETLITLVLDTYSNKNKLSILDLGTGSGCIAITLLAEIPSSKAVAIDINKEALKIAQKNANCHQVGERLTLLPGNWYNNLSSKLRFNVIIANPPYISYNEINQVAKETLKFEPSSALFAKGLECYAKIAERGKEFIEPGGFICVEIGYKKTEEVTKLFKLYNYTLIEKYKDLSGHDRCLKFAV